MKHIKNPLILVFAIIGVCAVLFGGWHLYQQQSRCRAERRLSFSTPAPLRPVRLILSTMPPPPPQP